MLLRGVTVEKPERRFYMEANKRLKQLPATRPGDKVIRRWRVPRGGGFQVPKVISRLLKIREGK